MTSITLDEMQHDGLAMSVAKAVVLANDAAVLRGIDPHQSRLTITKELNPKRWHITDRQTTSPGAVAI